MLLYQWAMMSIYVGETTDDLGNDKSLNHSEIIDRVRYLHLLSASLGRFVPHLDVGYGICRGLPSGRYNHN